MTRRCRSRSRSPADRMGGERREERRRARSCSPPRRRKSLWHWGDVVVTEHGETASVLCHDEQTGEVSISIHTGDRAGLEPIVKVLADSLRKKNKIQ